MRIDSKCEKVGLGYPTPWTIATLPLSQRPLTCPRLWFRPNWLFRGRACETIGPESFGPEVVEGRIGQRHDRAQAVIPARELDHDEHVVVGHAFALGCVDGACKSIGHRCVAGGQSGRARAEHEPGLQEVAPLELVDSDLVGHLCFTYLS